jgi:hypothetical protein
VNLDLNNLHWYGWALLAFSSAMFLTDLANALRFIRRGDVDVGFLLSVCGLTVVLYMLVTP